MPNGPAAQPPHGGQVTPGEQLAPAAASTPQDTDAVENSEFAEDAAGGLSDLLEVWPDLLEEILEQDRAAWNAVKAVQPLSLEGDVLAVGIASRSDLDAFKAAGAAPLREAILSAVGITVRYVPRSMPQGGTPAARPEQSAEPAAEEPHRVPKFGHQGDDKAQPNGSASGGGNDPMARAAARLSALGPALAAPAWADPVPEEAKRPIAQQPPAPVQPAPTVPAPTVSAPTAPAPTPVQPAALEADVSVVPPNAAGMQTATQGSPATTPEPKLTVEPEAPVTPAVNPEVTAEPEVAAEPAARPRASTNVVVDDPYANDPYAGEPSEDPYDDPYASGSAVAAVPQPASAVPQPAAVPQIPAPRPTDPEPKLQPPVPAGGAALAPEAAREPGPGPTRTSPPSNSPNQASNRSSDQATAAAPVAAGEQPAAQGSPQDAPAPASKQPASPKFVRYGEAVVREVLGARFVEELPLGPGGAQQ